mgnify:FL=1
MTTHARRLKRGWWLPLVLLVLTSCARPSRLEPATAYDFGFILTVPAFDGVRVLVKTRSYDACRAMHRLVRIEQMRAAVQHETTECDDAPAR